MAVVMTDRIDTLAKQCWSHRIDGTLIDGHLHFDHRRFAELIVRECAEVCMKEIDIGWAMAPKSPWMAKQILEHFGMAA